MLRFVVQLLRTEGCDELADAVASLARDGVPDEAVLETLILAAPPGAACWGTRNAQTRGVELYTRVGPRDLGGLVAALAQSTPSGIPLHHVRYLALKSQPLPDDAMQHLVGGLLQSEHSAGLETLDLTGCDLTAVGTSALCQALQSGHGQGLRTLRLSWNPLGKWGGLAVSDLLQHNATIERLELQNTQLDVQAVVHLFAVLRDQRTLVHLDLAKAINFSRQEDMTKHCAQMLHMNNTLCSLNIANLKIGDLGAELLSRSLAGNASLRSLRLDGNNIGVIGGEHLASLLMRGSSLVELFLSGNQIGNDGATAFGAALAANSTLRVLDLTMCGIGDEGLYEIASGMAENTSVTALSLWGNHFEGGSPATNLFDELRGRFDALGIVTDFVTYEVDGAKYTARAN